jgi:hypothetical protein
MNWSMSPHEAGAVQHWFVYYKLDRQTAKDLEPRLRSMQRDAASGDVRARLMRRTDSADGLVTLMEVYDGIAEPAAFEGRLAAAVGRAGLPASLAAERRIERFEDL